MDNHPFEKDLELFRIWKAFSLLKAPAKWRYNARLWILEKTVGLFQTSLRSIYHQPFKLLYYSGCIMVAYL
jgi:hypothetical protein